MSLDSDFALLDRFASGEVDAFDRLVVKHQKVVYYMVMRIVGNHEDAADITQQAFIKALKEIGKFRRRSSFRTWLCKIAINLSRNHLKRAKRREVVSLTEREPDPSEDPSNEPLRKERDRRVRAAILELPERQRLTLILRVYHRMTHREIGEVLDTTENNSRANYFHALRNLRTILVEKGYVDELQ